MARRRFELVDPSINARKFWEVEANGSEVTTWWGRIGATPATKTKDFGTEARAEAEVERLVKEKTKKGYEPVGGKSPGKKSPGKKPSAKKCSVCGGPTKSGKCAEPWEHSNFRKGPPSKSRPKTGASKLTTDEINWLAQHGWSSAQIKAMSVAEARRLIAAGEPKAHGLDTKSAAAGVDARRQYRQDIIKVGVVALGPGSVDDVTSVQKMIVWSIRKDDDSSDDDMRVAVAIENGLVCTESGEAMIVVPRDMLDSTHKVIAAYVGEKVESTRGKHGKKGR